MQQPTFAPWHLMVMCWTWKKRVLSQGCILCLLTLWYYS